MKQPAGSPSLFGPTPVSPLRSTCARPASKAPGGGGAAGSGRGAAAKRGRWMGLLTLLLATGVGASCGEEAELARLTVDLGVEPSGLDFGLVTVGTARARPLELRNRGAIALTLERLELPDAFTLRGLEQPLEGQELAPGAVLTFDVVFLPREVGARQAHLSIRSDAGVAEVPLSGEGVSAPPQLAIEPAALDFGGVASGLSATRDVTVSNLGMEPAEIVSVQLTSTRTDASAVGTFQLEAALPLVVPGGGSEEVSIRFTPPVPGGYMERFEVLAAGLAEPLFLDLTGQGEEPPPGGVVCAPSTVDGGTLERGTTRTERVTCTAVGGPAVISQVTASGPVDLAFTLPPGGLDVPEEQAVELAFDLRAEGAVGARLAELLVEHTGARGTATTRIGVRFVVGEPSASATAVALELRWSTDGTDLDLHLVAPGGAPFFDPLDCYFVDAQRGTSDDWGVPGDPSDDCFLDQDDTDGLGPERINMTRAAPGVYRVYVHYYQDNRLGPSDAEVTVRLGGQPAGVVERRGLRCDDLWWVGEIQWDGATGTFLVVDRVERSPFGLNGC